MAETVLAAWQQRHLHSRTRPSIMWSRILNVCETIATIAEVADSGVGLSAMGGLVGSDSHLSAAATLLATVLSKCWSLACIRLRYPRRVA